MEGYVCYDAMMPPGGYVRVGDVTRAAKRLGGHVVIRRVSQPCLRCGGTGIYTQWHGVCYRCGGCGTDPRPEVLRFVDQEHAEALRSVVAAMSERAAAARREEEERAQARYLAKEAERAARREADERVQAERVSLQIKPILDIIEALESCPRDFAKELAASLRRGDALRGRGIGLAAGMAAKAVAGKTRWCKAVDEASARIRSRLEDYLQAVSAEGAA